MSIMNQKMEKRWKGCVVSGLSSSVVSVCSMLIKEFCGGKAGWNDRAIFIKTDLKPASESEAAALWWSQIYGKVMSKHFALCPIRNPIEPSILGNFS